MEPTYETDDRWQLAKTLINLPIKNGDIVFRKSNAVGPLGLPFTKIVSKMTDSKYTHAGWFYWLNGKLNVVEVTDIGTMCYRILDYFEFCPDQDFVIYRLQDIQEPMEGMLARATADFLDLDPVYDYRFCDENKFYCTEAVQYIYEELGYDLMRPKKIKEIVTPLNYWLLRMGNWIYTKLAGERASLNFDSPMYYVGNESNGGLLSSPLLVNVYKSPEAIKEIAENAKRKPG